MQDIFFERASDYLNFEFKLRLQRRPSYSLRAFARDLQMSPASLTEFLHNRQGMSFERVTSVAKVLNWSNEHKEHFWDLVCAKFARDMGARRSALARVNERIKRVPTKIHLDAFKMMSDWYHLAILELVRIRPEFGSPSQVAGQLNLPVPVAREAMARLARLELLEQFDDRRYRTSTKTSQAGDEGPSEAVRVFHHQMMSLSQEALEKVPYSQRESLSIIFSGKKRDLQEMRAEVRDAIYGIVSRFAKGEPEDTLQAVTLQIFPLWEAPAGVADVQSNKERGLS
jgi:uncharacterized protein (TIGR02147 family)